MPETIVAYLRPAVPLAGQVGLGYHAWLVYTRADGYQESISGGPVNASIRAPTGILDTYAGPYVNDTRDYKNRNNYVDSEVIASGPNLSTAWAAAKTSANNFDMKYFYNPVYTNSNSVVYTALKDAGLPVISIDSVLPSILKWFAPGSATDLNTNTQNLTIADLVQMVQATQLQGAYRNVFANDANGALFRGNTYDLWGTGISVNYNGHWQRQINQVFDQTTQAWLGFDGWVWVDETSRARMTPVVLDLNRNGINLIDAAAGPGFDFFGTGYRQALGWTNDAILFFDADGNGIASDATEISLLHHHASAETDLKALASFDTNGDGLFSAGDMQFSQFRTWVDANQNGTSEASEVMTLAQAGVVSIALTSTGTASTVGRNGIFGSSVVTLANGLTTSAYDVAFDAHGVAGRRLTTGAQWTTLQTETQDIVAVLTDTSALAPISNIFALAPNGYTTNAFQFGDNNEVIDTGPSEQSRSLYVDAGGGNDSLFFSSNTRDSVIKGGHGDDVIRGTLGSDFIFPGTGSNLIVDLYGDDFYGVDVGTIVSINDGAGGDTLLLKDYASTQVQFLVSPNDSRSVLLTALDGSMSVTIELMRIAPAGSWTNPNIVEYFIFNDRYMTADEVFGVVGYYQQPSGGGGDPGGGGGGGWENIMFNAVEPGVQPELLLADSVDYSPVSGTPVEAADGRIMLAQPNTYLVLDRNLDGLINLLSETHLGMPQSQAANVSNLLGIFDTNHDGKLSSADFEFAAFYEWSDQDGDGVIGQGELRNLKQSGVFEVDFAGAPPAYVQSAYEPAVIVAPETVIA